MTKGGTSQHPLPPDSKSRMGMHFAGLMYNARTDTLFTKSTFSRLAQQGRSCLVALDGYFEWKASPLAGGKGKKQPYFVFRRQGKNESQERKGETPPHGCPPYLLLAGLWTRVPTGLVKEPFLDTFTILTTEACSQIAWLHHRMPVCIWDIELAKRWLQDPSPIVHRDIDMAAKSNNEGFNWHAVTTEMSSVKFRGKEAIQPMRGPKSVTAFFTQMGSTLSSPSKSITRPNSSTGREKSNNSTESNNRASNDGIRKHEGAHSHKRALSLKTPPSNTASKKARIDHPESPKKGLITSFFQKKP